MGGGGPLLCQLAQHVAGVVGGLTSTIGGRQNQVALGGGMVLEML